MTIEVDDDASPQGTLSPEEDAFWGKFLAAWRAEGSPPAERICLLAWDELKVKIAPSTVQGWIDGKRIPRIWESERPQPFKAVLKVLRVEEPVADWEQLARSAHRAKTKRLKNKGAVVQAPAAPTLGEPASGDQPEPADGNGDQQLEPAPHPGSDGDTEGDAQPLTVTEPEPTDPPAAVGEQPDVAAPDTSTPPGWTAPPPAPLPADPPPYAKRPRRRLHLITAAVIAAALAATAITIGIVAARQKEPTPPADTLSSFEARVNGVQAGVENPLARTISIYSEPGTPDSGCDYSPCIRHSKPVGTVHHGQTIKVVCVTTGQRIRNGVKDTDHYHDDDRWVQLAPGQGVVGNGYLSNTYFARIVLPPNLPRCPR